MRWFYDGFYNITSAARVQFYCWTQGLCKPRSVCYIREIHHQLSGAGLAGQGLGLDPGYHTWKSEGNTRADGPSVTLPGEKDLVKMCVWWDYVVNHRGACVTVWVKPHREP